MGLPKTLQINEEGDITNPDECNLFIAGVDPFEIEVGTAIVARYNAHAALRLVYDEVQRLRGMGYIYTKRVVEALDTCEVALRGEAGEQTRT